jgi:hypothetical protein
MFRYALAAPAGAAVALLIERRVARVDREVSTAPSNAENGVVPLRGGTEEPARIVESVARTRRIRGVADVENLMHLPGDSVPRS